MLCGRSNSQSDLHRLIPREHIQTRCCHGHDHCSGSIVYHLVERGPHTTSQAWREARVQWTLEAGGSWRCERAMGIGLSYEPVQVKEREHSFVAGMTTPALA